MNIKLGQLRAVLTGSVKPFTRQSASGIHKQPTVGAILTHKIGLQGDAQGDLRVHGGPDKAIHHYPFDHYSAWQHELGNHPLLQQAGAFGENFSTLGITEKDVCMGDEIQVGTALLQVSQCRQPCWKLNDYFNIPEMAMTLQKTARVGWYYRVLKEGVIQAGDALYLTEQPYPDWPLDKVARLMFNTQFNREEHEQFVQLPLTDSWRRTITKRLESGEIEDWTRRLYGS